MGGVLICTVIRSNTVGYLHSDLTHLRQELLVCNQLFTVVPAVHVSKQMVGHFSVQLNNISKFARPDAYEDAKREFADYFSTLRREEYK